MFNLLSRASILFLRAARLPVASARAELLRRYDAYLQVLRANADVLELLSELERHREPILITQHGLPSAYLLDVETYENLQRRIALLEGIARGEKAIEEGRTVSHAAAKKRIVLIAK